MNLFNIHPINRGSLNWVGMVYFINTTIEGYEKRIDKSIAFICLVNAPEEI